MNLDTRAHRSAQEIHRAVEVMAMSTITKEPRKVERFDRYRDRKQRNRRVGAALVACVLATAAVVFAASTLDRADTNTQNTGVAPRGRILFGLFDADTQSDHLFTISADGTHVLDLGVSTDPGAHWSPDGSRILVSRTGPAALLRPATIRADGSGLTLLDATDVPLLSLACSTWSPDGARLACEGFNETGHDEIGGLYTVRSSDGGGLTRLTETRVIPVDYSPDGTQIAFFEKTNRDFGFLAVVNIDGTGIRRITPRSFAAGSASWSPDGRWIAFTAFTGFSRDGGDLYLVRPDGTDRQRIDLPKDSGLVSAGSPTWSPDGSWIAFRGFEESSLDADVYAIRVDGSDLRQITDTPGVDEGDLDWAPA